MRPVDNSFSCRSLSKHELLKFKFRPKLPDCRDEADWLKCAARQM